MRFDLKSRARVGRTVGEGMSKEALSKKQEKKKKGVEKPPMHKALGIVWHSSIPTMDPVGKTWR